MSQSCFNPTPGFEEAYQSGWDKASSEATKRAERRFGVVAIILGFIVIAITVVFDNVQLAAEPELNVSWTDLAMELVGSGLVVGGLWSLLFGKPWHGKEF